jgi:hypothetical protein
MKCKRDGANTLLVYLLITYVLKDKPKNKDITVIPFKKWITEQHRRERLKVAPHAKARGIQNGIPRWLTARLLAIEDWTNPATPDTSANIAEELAYTLVSGSYDPLTRRYAPTAASPCCDHSDRAQKPLSRF